MAERLVLDTSVLIDYKRKRPEAGRFVTGLVGHNAGWVHPVAVAELVEGVRDRADLTETMAFLLTLRRVPVKHADLEQCIVLLARFGLSHGVGWPDCLMAATCLRLDLPFVTVNDRDFRIFRGLKVVRPY